MKVDRSEVVRQLKRQWPHLVDGLPNPTNIAMPDGQYWLITKRELEWAVSDTFMERYRYKAEGMDCDDFAMILHAWVVQERYREIVERGAGTSTWFPWAFGQCWGSRFRGQDTGHAINICVTRDVGILLVEPQNDRIWEAEDGEDIAHFIRI